MKYDKILILFLVLFIFCACNDEVRTAKKMVVSDIYFCKIVTSSADKEAFLLDTNTWHSSKIAKDDLIFFFFQEPIFVKKLTIEQANNNLTNCRVFSNNGLIGDFEPANIELNQTIKFLTIKFQNVRGFSLCDAYCDSGQYQIAFEELNSPVFLKKITFFANDSTEINLISVRKSSFDAGLPVPKNKYLDYSIAEKSIAIKNNGEIVGDIDDTLFYGFANKNSKSTATFLRKIVFENDNSKISSFDTHYLYIDKNIVRINGLADFMFDFRDDFFVDVKSLDPTIVLDIRYATENNFMKQKVYDCPFCFLRYAVAKSLIKAQQEFRQKGYGIKVYDCYRPHSAQYKLWKIVPNKNYVANPEKGSIHNRGGAVDLTLVDSLGNELDMGTDFDFFGYKAFSINLDLPDTVLANRNLLWSVMQKNGFRPIKTEWWHLSHFSCLKYEISDIKFPCKD